MKPYATYSAEELALDDLFVRWVQHPHDDEVAGFWQGFLQQHTHRQFAVETARRLVQSASSLPLSRDLLPPDELTNLWKRIRGSLEELDEVKLLQPNVRSVVAWWYFGRTVAAVLGIVLLISWGLFMQWEHSEQTVQNRSNQTTLVRLPDGSSAQLHQRSQLRYARQWTGDAPHAVWLTGTAQFSVSHAPNTATEPFRVHTPDLTIEATGTRFSVWEQGGSTQIALQSGQITLLLHDQNRRITLRPGDSVEVCAGMVRPVQLSAN